MKLKSDKQSISALERIGIRTNHAKRIAGKSCKPTGRTGNGFIQVEFKASILKRKSPFVFCVPLCAIA